jgi:hypothetical protein
MMSEKEDNISWTYESCCDLFHLTGPQVYDYVGFSIKSIVSTETNLTSTASCCFYVYLRQNSKSWFHA